MMSPKELLELLGTSIDSEYPRMYRLDAILGVRSSCHSQMSTTECDSAPAFPVPAHLVPHLFHQSSGFKVNCQEKTCAPRLVLWWTYHRCPSKQFDPPVCCCGMVGYRLLSRNSDMTKGYHIKDKQRRTFPSGITISFCKPT